VLVVCGVAGVRLVRAAGRLLVVMGVGVVPGQARAHCVSRSDAGR
jgi:hypothetical protein